MSLSQNINYEIDFRFARNGVQNLPQYDLVIFHDLPSKKHPLRTIVSQLDRLKTPRFFIIGRKTNLSEFNQIQKAVNISGNNANSNSSQALISKEFSAFTISDNLINQLEAFVPLTCPFGQYRLGLNTDILLYQKIIIII